MHEVSIATEIIEIVEECSKEYELNVVKNITLNIGEFSCIEEGSLKFAFGILSKDTICENSNLDIIFIKATAYCHNCKEIFDINFTNKKCPKCNIASSDIKTGNEFLIQSIEGE